MIELLAGWTALAGEPEARMLGLQAAGFAGVVVMFIASMTAAAMSARAVSKARRLVLEAEAGVAASQNLARDLQARLDAFSQTHAETTRREVRIGAAVDTPEAEIAVERTADEQDVVGARIADSEAIEALDEPAKSFAPTPLRGAIWRRR